jgi:hypothetical protein
VHHNVAGLQAPPGFTKEPDKRVTRSDGAGARAWVSSPTGSIYLPRRNAGDADILTLPAVDRPSPSYTGIGVHKNRATDPTLMYNSDLTDVAFP